MNINADPLIKKEVIVNSQDELRLLADLYSTEEKKPSRLQVELRPCEQLRTFGATFEREGKAFTQLTFQGTEHVKFELVLYLQGQRPKQILGDIELFDLEHSRLLDVMKVHILETKDITQVEPWPHRWAFDMGAQRSTLVSRIEQTVQAFFPPLPTLLQILPGEAAIQSRLCLPQKNSFAGVGVVSQLKEHVGDVSYGPAVAYPLKWNDLQSKYISEVIGRASELAMRLPREMVVTVPADWSSERILTYKKCVEESFKRAGANPPYITSMDEATAGLIGILQQQVEQVTAAGARYLLSDEVGKPTSLLNIDIGATRTSMSLVELTIQEKPSTSNESPPHFLASTSLKGLNTLPLGGHTFTRILAACMASQIALQMPGIAELELRYPRVKQDLEALARVQGRTVYCQLMWYKGPRRHKHY